MAVRGWINYEDYEAAALKAAQEVHCLGCVEMVFNGDPCPHDPPTIWSGTTMEVMTSFGVLMEALGIEIPTEKRKGIGRFA